MLMLMLIVIVMYACLAAAALAAIAKLKTVYRMLLILGLFLSLVASGLAGGKLGVLNDAGRILIAVISTALMLTIAEHIYAAWAFRGMSIPRTSRLKTLRGRIQIFYVTLTKYLKMLWLTK